LVGFRIAVDAHMVGERETGNETYTRNLLRGLADQPDSDHYLCLTPDPLRLRPLDLPANFEPVRVWPGQSLIRVPVATPLAVRRKRAHLLHMTTYVTPPWSPCPTVVTIHDLSFLEYPNAFSWRVRTMLSRLVPGSVARAARVIAVSEWTKHDLVRRYGVPPEKIAVTPEAAPPGFSRLPDAQRRPLPVAVREPFVLAVGNLEPRKNLARLIQAFGVVVREHGFTGQLVLVGKAHMRAGDAQQAARESGIESRVAFTGYVSHDDLMLLYNRASVFVYPSLYEGFGLPPLEAMACGCPVVASNVTALPEVLGDGALLVNPLSVEELAQAIAAVLQRPELAASLREKGAQRAASYSWSATAAKTREVYAQVLAGRS
ncbi:MAG TPA: glycosyltransferase family 1 protein, partial [Isosphaeraceae bacterium]|nr:glycosyltransferase family 1 protein [Isosphaeraceae bacterium]